VGRREGKEKDKGVGNRRESNKRQRKEIVCEGMEIGEVHSEG